MTEVVRFDSTTRTIIDGEVRVLEADRRPKTGRIIDATSSAIGPWRSPRWRRSPSPARMRVDELLAFRSRTQRTQGAWLALQPARQSSSTQQ